MVVKSRRLQAKNYVRGSALGIMLAGMFTRNPVVRGVVISALYLFFVAFVILYRFRIG